MALAVKLKLADGLIERDAPKARELVGQLQGETHAALEDLRDLARGIYPPLLADKGLSRRSRRRRGSRVCRSRSDADAIGRYPQDIEAAVYFSCLEAMQNIAKYASASSAVRDDRRARPLVALHGLRRRPWLRSGCGDREAPGCKGSRTGSVRWTARSRSRRARDAGTTIEGRLPVPAGAESMA